MLTDPYAVKTVEYLTGLTFLVAFIAFWRYVNGEPAIKRATAWAGHVSDWFRVPERLLFHRGHGWARLEGGDIVTIGLDDFAQQLVGRVDRVELPKPGMQLGAGAPAWTLHADGRSVDMLAPLGGTVMSVNAAVAAEPGLVNSDPYGRGWLMRVHVPRAKDALKTLVTGKAAREWIAKVSDDMVAAMSPELGHVLQDGGVPVHGIAKAIEPERWDAVARKFLQS